MRRTQSSVLHQDVLNRLNMWGKWVVQNSAGSLGFGNSPLAGMMTTVARAEPGCMIPLNDIDASRTNDAIESLSLELRRIAVMYWGRNWTIRVIAKTERISTRTAHKRIDEVVQGVAKYILEGFSRFERRERVW